MRGRRVAFGLVVAVLAPLLWVVAMAPTASASAPPTWFTTFHALTPARLLDTRPGYSTIDGQFQGGGQLIPMPAASLALQVAGRGGVPTSGVGAVAVNVTVTNSTAPGFLSLSPAASIDPVHFSIGTSSLNWEAGQTVANMAIVPLASGALPIATYARTDVVIDVLGWFPPGPSGSALTPARLLDTRPASPTVDGRFAGVGSIAGGRALDLPVTGRGGVPASGVSAVAINVTVDHPGASSYLTVFPTGTPKPNSSNVNFVAGQTVANMTIVPVGPDGRISLANYDGATDLVVDVLGWFPTSVAPPQLQRLVGPVDGPVSSPYDGDASMSADGRFVAFATSATGLVPDDTDGHVDVFVRNVASGATQRLSGPGVTNGDAVQPQLSRDGSTLAFVDATPGFPNQQLVVVRLADGQVQRFTVRPYGRPSISADGRLVVFESFDWYLPTPGPNFRENVWLLDTATGAVSLVSARADGTPGDSQSTAAVLAPDGRSVVYASSAANLTGVAGSVVLVRTTLADHATVAVGDPSVPACTGRSADFMAGPAAAVSVDGTRLAYSSMPFSTTTCVRDLTTGTTRVIDSGRLPGVDLATLHLMGAPAISDDGQLVAVASSFAGPNDCAVFVDGLTTGVVERYDTPGLLCQADLAMTPDGDHLLVTARAGGDSAQPFALFSLDRSTG